MSISCQLRLFKSKKSCQFISEYGRGISITERTCINDCETELKIHSGHKNEKRLNVEHLYDRYEIQKGIQKIT